MHIVRGFGKRSRISNVVALTACVSAAGPAEARACPGKTTAHGPRRHAPTAATAGQQAALVPGGRIGFREHPVLTSAPERSNCSHTAAGTTTIVREDDRLVAGG